MRSNDSPQPLFAALPMERRIVELTILWEVSRALQDTHDEEKALYSILVGVTYDRGLGFNRAFILLVDREERHLSGRLAIGPSSSEEAATIWQDLREKHMTLGELLRSIHETGIKRDLKVNGIVSRFQIPLSESQNPLVRIMRSHEACLAASGAFVPHGFPREQVRAPVILNTAYSSYQDYFLTWAADGYIIKSADLKPLKAKIREVLEARGAAQTGRTE